MLASKGFVIRAVAAVAVVLALAAPARAGNMSDMTVDSLTFKYTPTPGAESFEAFTSGGGAGSLVSWTKADGTPGTFSPLLGSYYMTWDKASSTGVLTVSNQMNGDLLQGTITDFFWNGAQAFTAHVTLGTTFLDFAPGQFLEVAMTASSLVFDRGTGKYLGAGDMNVVAVPEPTTLGLLGLGSALVAVRRRRTK